MHHVLIVTKQGDRESRPGGRVMASPMNAVIGHCQQAFYVQSNSLDTDRLRWVALDIDRSRTSQIMIGRAVKNMLPHVPNAPGAAALWHQADPTLCAYNVMSIGRECR